jgi:hypothetical protein
LQFWAATSLDVTLFGTIMSHLRLPSGRSAGRPGRSRATDALAALESCVVCDNPFSAVQCGQRTLSRNRVCDMLLLVSEGSRVLPLGMCRVRLSRWMAASNARARTQSAALQATQTRFRPARGRLAGTRANPDISIAPTDLPPPAAWTRRARAAPIRIARPMAPASTTCVSLAAATCTAAPASRDVS